MSDNRLKKGTLRHLEEEISKAVIKKAKEIVEASDVVVSLRHTKDSFKGSITIRKTPTYTEDQFLEFAPKYGINPNLLHQIIQVSNNQFKVVGWNQSARYYKILCQSKDGSEIALTPAIVQYLYPEYSLNND